LKKIITTPLAKVPINAVLAEDIIYDNSQFLLACGTILSIECIKLLENYAVQQVAIVVETQTLNSNNGEIITNNIINPIIKSELQNTVEQVFLTPKDVKIKLDKITGIIEKVIDKLRSKSDAFLHLNNLYDKDNELVAHNVNVSLFSLIIGIKMGISLSDLVTLGVGSLLHDIGKMHIPAEIINKPTKLTTDEYELVKKHATIGYNILKQNAKLDYRVMLIVLQHHERCNGQGYPWGISQAQIDPLAQIIAVADVYEALTANRAYRKRFTAEKAISLVNENVDSHFASKVIEAFDKVVVPYNLGETVKLSNGMVGKVTGVNSADLKRPKVFTNQGIFNLVNTPNVHVVCTLN